MLILKLIFVFSLLINVVCSQIIVKEKGLVVPLEKSDIALTFYAIVFNVGQTPVSSQLKMIECCQNVGHSEVDCESMELLSGQPVLMGPGETTTLKLFYSNLYLFGRVGQCTIRVDNSQPSEALDNLEGSSDENGQELTIKFDTRLPGSSFFSGLFQPDYGKYNYCSSIDEDIFCSPVNCLIKYSGHRSFYNLTEKSCLISPDCSLESPTTTEETQTRPKIIYSKISNKCKHVNRIMFSSEMGLLEDINEFTAFREVPILFNCNNGVKNVSLNTCECYEGWSSVEFDPANFNLDSDVYEMCTVRTSAGYLADRAFSTRTSLIVLIVLLILLLLFLCFACWMFIYRKKSRRKRSKARVRKFVQELAGHSSDDGIDSCTEILKEIKTRREQQKYSDIMEARRELRKEQKKPQKSQNNDYQSSKGTSQSTIIDMYRDHKDKSSYKKPAKNDKNGYAKVHEQDFKKEKDPAEVSKSPDKLQKVKEAVRQNFAKNPENRAKYEEDRSFFDRFFTWLNRPEDGQKSGQKSGHHHHHKKHHEKPPKYEELSSVKTESNEKSLKRSETSVADSTGSGQRLTRPPWHYNQTASPSDDKLEGPTGSVANTSESKAGKISNSKSPSDLGNNSSRPPSVHSQNPSNFDEKSKKDSWSTLYVKDADSERSHKIEQMSFPEESKTVVETTESISEAGMGEKSSRKTFKTITTVTTTTSRRVVPLDSNDGQGQGQGQNQDQGQIHVQDNGSIIVDGHKPPESEDNLGRRPSLTSSIDRQIADAIVSHPQSISPSLSQQNQHQNQAPNSSRNSKVSTNQNYETQSIDLKRTPSKSNMLLNPNSPSNQPTIGPVRKSIADQIEVNAKESERINSKRAESEVQSSKSQKSLKKSKSKSKSGKSKTSSKGSLKSKSNKSDKSKRSWFSKKPSRHEVTDATTTQDDGGSETSKSSSKAEKKPSRWSLKKSKNSKNSKNSKKSKESKNSKNSKNLKKSGSGGPKASESVESIERVNSNSISTEESASNSSLSMKPSYKFGFNEENTY